MMNAYLSMQGRHTKEVHEFPMFFAFDKEQFKRGMEKFGLTEHDTDQICSFGGTGGYYRKSDAPRLLEMFDRHHKERQDAINSDKSGTGYIFQMFYYELAAQEYGYTMDATATLEMLGMTMEDIEKSKALTNGLNKVISKLLKEDIF
jgi:hypothetical protein